LRKIVFSAVLVSLCVVLSGVYIPVGPTKVFPFQHMVNAIAGVFLGPVWAGIVSLIAALLRNILGTGTIFAFPGGIPGGIVVGIFYMWVKKDWVALLEPIGTGPIGATLSVWLVMPYVGYHLGWFTLQIAFLSSSIPGSLLGFLLIKIVRRRFSLNAGHKTNISRET